MDKNKYNIQSSIPESSYLEYIEALETLVYKVLCIYEECLNTGDFEPWHIYLDGLITQMIGSKYLFDDTIFVVLLSTLMGISQREDLTKRKVKSIVLGCCKKLNKARGFNKEDK